MPVRKEIFAEITLKKVQGGKWNHRITCKELDERGRIKKISYKLDEKQIVQIRDGRKYHWVYENGNLVHADVEETKTGVKRKIIENGIVVTSLQKMYERIKNQNISDLEKIIALDACL